MSPLPSVSSPEEAYPKQGLDCDDQDEFKIVLQKVRALKLLRSYCDSTFWSFCPVNISKCYRYCFCNSYHTKTFELIAKNNKKHWQNYKNFLSQINVFISITHISIFTQLKKLQQYSSPSILS